MTLLSECIEALGDQAEVFSKEKSKELVNKFANAIPFAYGKVNWKLMSNISYIETFDNFKFPSSECYIIWSGNAPVIKSDLQPIIENLDDVTAVSFETYFFFMKNESVIEFYNDKIVFGRRGR